jgi:hypothetical protein
LGDRALAGVDFLIVFALVGKIEIVVETITVVGVFRVIGLFDTGWCSGLVWWSEAWSDGGDINRRWG